MINLLTEIVILTGICLAGMFMTYEICRDMVVGMRKDIDRLNTKINMLMKLHAKELDKLYGPRRPGRIDIVMDEGSITASVTEEQKWHV